MMGAFSDGSIEWKEQFYATITWEIVEVATGKLLTECKKHMERIKVLDSGNIAVLV